MSPPRLNSQRRSFLRDLIPRVARYCADIGEEIRGRPQMLLDDLASWPDVVLREVIPVFAQGTEVGLEAASLRLRGGDCGELEVVLPIDAVHRAVLQRFGTGSSLGKMAEEVAAEGLCCDFGVVRELFLTLARRAMCHPAQSLAELDAAASAEA